MRMAAISRRMGRIGESVLVLVFPALRDLLLVLLSSLCERLGGLLACFLFCDFFHRQLAVFDSWGETVVFAAVLSLSFSRILFASFSSSELDLIYTR